MCVLPLGVLRHRVGVGVIGSLGLMGGPVWLQSPGAELRLWETLCLRFHLLVGSTRLCGWHLEVGGRQEAKVPAGLGGRLRSGARGHTPTWAREPGSTALDSQTSSEAPWSDHTGETEARDNH